jgi:micrococcal nuclease
MPTPQGFAVTVQQVLNGRDLEVSGLEAYPEITERVRLAAIEVPDGSQHPSAMLAKQLLDRQIQGQTVTLEPDVDTHDQDGYRLAYLWHHGALLNEKLVSEGFAIAPPSSPTSKYATRLAHAQDKARLLGIGLWNPKEKRWAGKKSNP